jgi:hypothetical protein
MKFVWKNINENDVILRIVMYLNKIKINRWINKKCSFSNDCILNIKKVNNLNYIKINNRFILIINYLLS